MKAAWGNSASGVYLGEANCRRMCAAIVFGGSGEGKRHDDPPDRRTNVSAQEPGDALNLNV